MGEQPPSADRSMRSPQIESIDRTPANRAKVGYLSCLAVLVGHATTKTSYIGCRNGLALGL
jgi:hypothetical protein